MRTWLVPALLALIAGAAPPHSSALSTADEFAAIDRYALAAPRSATGSVSALSAYLAKGVTSDRAKARAMFRWITHYVAYDPSAEAFSLDPNAVLRSRRAVCMGYAVLFEALAQAAGMKAEVILGHAKEFKPAAAAGLDQWLNHSWNAVEIDGRWQLLDCCWGAGHYDKGGQFVRSFTPHYFLTAPQDFVCDHFPRDPRWQLLDPPLARDDYGRRVQVRPAFFDCELRLVSHHSYQIEAGNSLELVIGAPSRTYVSALLYRDGQELDDHYTFAQRYAQGFLVRAVFPSGGTYILRIFARQGDAASGDYTWALDYEVRASAGQGSAPGFPQAYGPFLAKDCELEQPLSRVLAAGRDIEFSLTVPGAEEMVVATGGSWCRLSADRGRFTGRVPVSSGDVLVFARFANQHKYEGLLRYTGEEPAWAAAPPEVEAARLPLLARYPAHSRTDATPWPTTSRSQPDFAYARYDPFALLSEPASLPKGRHATVLGSRAILLPHS